MKDEFLYFPKAERRLILFASILAFAILQLPVISESESISWCETGQLDDIFHEPQNGAGSTNSYLDSCIAIGIDSVGLEEWNALGAAPWIAERIEKYRSKGGRIHTLSDLKKIYGIDTNWVNRVAHCIIWKKEARSRTITPKQNFSKKYPVKRYFDIDINTADSSMWAKLPGIGSVLSRRIVTFRDKLGGFYSPLQVAETYGLKDSTFRKLEPHLKVLTPHKQLPINQLGIRELAGHPYIDWKTAKLIFNYRSHHGPFKNKEDILSIKALDTTLVISWLPYLDFHENDSLRTE